MDQSTTGTPAYMAPECILGDVDVDRRADVYALGCVAYFALTGSLVFDAENSMQMLMHHLHTRADATLGANGAAHPAGARRPRPRLPAEGPGPAPAERR